MLRNGNYTDMENKLYMWQIYEIFLFIDKPLVSSEAGTLYNPASKLVESEKQVSNSPKQLTSIEKLSVSWVYSVA